MIRFVQRTTGEIFRVLLEFDSGLWLISYQESAAPFFVASAFDLGRIETPASFLAAQQRPLTQAEERRLVLIQPLLDTGEQCITDKGHRLNAAKEIAASSKTTTKRVCRAFRLSGQIKNQPWRSLLTYCRAGINRCCEGVESSRMMPRNAGVQTIEHKLF